MVKFLIFGFIVVMAFLYQAPMTHTIEIVNTNTSHNLDVAIIMVSTRQSNKIWFTVFGDEVRYSVLESIATVDIHCNRPTLFFASGHIGTMSNQFTYCMEAGENLVLSFENTEGSISPWITIADRPNSWVLNVRDDTIVALTSDRQWDCLNNTGTLEKNERGYKSIWIPC